MPPTPQSTLAAATSSSAKPSTPYSHQPSIPAMIVLALFMSMMAALAISVILRQRKDMESFRHYNNLGIPKENQKRQKPRPRSWFTFSRPAKHRFGTAAESGAGAEDKDSPTAVGTLHAASVLLAAAPCQVFSPPMAMHFKITLQDDYNNSHSKTVLILGVPWPPALACSAQCRGGGAPAVRSDAFSGVDDR